MLFMGKKIRVESLSVSKAVPNLTKSTASMLGTVCSAASMLGTVVANNAHQFSKKIFLDNDFNLFYNFFIFSKIQCSKKNDTFEII